ncbi:unnamed protein product [Prorocentrum cordatum]|uniref:FACT complex subunit n=1 Tax=Prorocentrum cordatum TaxID=2364126 RepID=A0ABN9SL70_9DINO|nr:unnamed protein product [Polarella glacialis]
MLVLAPSSRLLWLTIPTTSIPKKILMLIPVPPRRLEWPAWHGHTVLTKLFMMMLGLPCRLVWLPTLVTMKIDMPGLKLCMLMHVPSRRLELTLAAMKIDIAGLSLVHRVFVEPTCYNFAAAARPWLHWRRSWWTLKETCMTLHAPSRYLEWLTLFPTTSLKYIRMMMLTTTSGEAAGTTCAKTGTDRL